MPSLQMSLLIAAALGSGLMAGLFCSFSNFIMKALAETPPRQGIEAMQAINRVIVRPLFLLVFLGTGVVCGWVVGFGWKFLDDAVYLPATVGGLVYLIGSVFVTIACNVPLNDRLAAVASENEEGTRMWELYLVRWTRWNHVRSVATLLSTLLLLVALLRANEPG